MFRNLIENSIKYSSSDKIIVDFHKNYLEISNDFSYTIKEEEKNKLFEAFYKLNYDSFSY
jgi:signal transduction histidine kinase